MAIGRLVGLALSAMLASCQTPLPEGAECWSLDHRVLRAPQLPPDVLADREVRLDEARRRLAANPTDRDAAIWVGRRLGYLGRYREAIAVYTAALEQHPGDAFLLRHRGHRYISVREFARAVDDLRAAADACRSTPDEIEPDGLPVPGRPPHSSLHFNVYYHLGLALFLRASSVAGFERAEDAWRSCLAVCAGNDEARVAVSHWLWCARMRCGNPAGAAAVVASITPDMDVVENVSYHQLCLLYAGQLSRQRMASREGSSGAALAFGLAHYDLVVGDRDAARRQFDQLLDSDGWAAFGVIAAEAALARWR